MRRVSSSDGIEIAVEQSGPPSAPVIVAIHGYPDNHHVWDGLVAELADHHIVRYDVRGAGESDRPASRAGYRIEQLVDDVYAVLDAVAPERPVHLLGHDWGAVQGWAAIEDPRAAGRIAGYTAISGPALDHAAAWLRDARRYPRPALRQLAHSYYTALFQLPGLPEAAIRAGLFDRTIGPRDHSDAINGLNLYRANLRRRRTLRARPARIDLPVQVIAPHHDPFITVDFATGAPAPYARSLRTQVIPGGHWVIVDHPERVAGYLRDFIADLEPTNR